MSIQRRIVSGTVANTAGIAMSAVAQLMSVPMLTLAWGVERYGLWLMLTTIPAYFALSDLGFASAATSDMTMQVARGHRKQARATFQSVWLLVNLVSLAMIASTAGVVEAQPYLGSAPPWIREHGSVLVLLVVYSGVVMNARVMLAGLRATENYAMGTMVYQVVTFFEVLLVMLLAWAGLGFLECAAGMLFAEVLNVIAMWTLLRNRVPWLQLGLTYAALPELRRLWKPAVAAMAIPMALAVNLQGMLLVAGICVSASAAATLASVRTVSRVAIQLVGAINRATMPELSAAGARDHRSALTKIVALNVATVGLILAPGALLFAIFGGRIVEIWTHDTIRPEAGFVGLIALSMVVHGMWFYTSNLLLASNAHTLVARLLVVISVGAIFLAIPAAWTFGLIGIGEVLVLTEVCCLFCVLRVASRLHLISLTNMGTAFKLRFWRS